MSLLFFSLFFLSFFPENKSERWQGRRKHTCTCLINRLIVRLFLFFGIGADLLQILGASLSLLVRSPIGLQGAEEVVAQLKATLLILRRIDEIHLLHGLQRGYLLHDGAVWREGHSSQGSFGRLNYLLDRLSVPRNRIVGLSLWNIYSTSYCNNNKTRCTLQWWAHTLGNTLAPTAPPCQALCSGRLGAGLGCALQMCRPKRLFDLRARKQSRLRTC